MARSKAPHLVQYQGSKRILAPAILEYIPKNTKRLVEPFCGVCAVSIAAAQEGKAEQYWINDINEPLVRMMKKAIEEPDQLADEYQEIWEGQFAGEGDHVAHFLEQREIFNNGDRSEARLLYLIARCVKGAVRYGSNGQLNQSPDKRRNGTKPKTVRRNAKEISLLLKGRCEFTSMDFQEVFKQCEEGDLLYMDPPYQGTSFVRDNRYYQGVYRSDLIEGLELLNEKRIDFLLSYDGMCGTKEYGEDLPDELGCRKIMLDAGRSTQATFLGKDEKTLEALYLSPNIAKL